MNEFVDKCRREWKRLGVPDSVADEMAGDLAADLDEAAAEGASPEEVLGTGAQDAHSFAAAWAAERGVTGAATPPRRPRAVLAALAAFAALTVLGLVLVVAAPSRTARMAVPAPIGRVFFFPRRLVRPPRLPRVWIARPSRTQMIALADGRPALWWAGLAVLVVGIGGIAATSVVSLRR